MTRMIDADALIHWIEEEQCKGCQRGGNGNCPARCALVDMRKKARELSVVDVMPVTHGHWVSSLFKDMYICSNCRQYYIRSDEAYDFKYCPHCGAKNE